MNVNSSGVEISFLTQSSSKCLLIAACTAERSPTEGRCVCRVYSELVSSSMWLLVQIPGVAGLLD